MDRSGDDALWEGSLSLKNYPFLDDHRIDGKIVVPWAVAVELMAETVQAAWPQLHVVEAQKTINSCVESPWKTGRLCPSGLRRG